LVETPKRRHRSWCQHWAAARALWTILLPASSSFVAESGAPFDVACVLSCLVQIATRVPLSLYLGPRLVNAVSLRKRPNSLYLQNKLSPYLDALQHLSPLPPVLRQLLPAVTPRPAASFTQAGLLGLQRSARRAHRGSPEPATIVKTHKPQKPCRDSCLSASSAQVYQCCALVCFQQKSVPYVAPGAEAFAPPCPRSMRCSVSRVVPLSRMRGKPICSGPRKFTLTQTGFQLLLIRMPHL
jgi:hypothetical protein